MMIDAGLSTEHVPVKAIDVEGHVFMVEDDLAMRERGRAIVFMRLMTQQLSCSL